MDPADAAYSLATRGRSLSGELRASVHARMSELERVAGGKARAARLAGVAPRTWRDWRAGAHRPSVASAERLRGALRRSRIRPDQEARMRQFDGVLTIKGVLRYSREERSRMLKLTRANTPARAHGAPGRMLDATLAGDDAGAGAELEGLVAAYQPGLVVVSISKISIT